MISPPNSASLPTICCFRVATRKISIQRLQSYRRIPGNMCPQTAVMYVDKAHALPAQNLTSRGQRSRTGSKLLAIINSERLTSIIQSMNLHNTKFTLPAPGLEANSGRTSSFESRAKTALLGHQEQQLTPWFHPSSDPFSTSPFFPWAHCPMADDPGRFRVNGPNFLKGSF